MRDLCYELVQAQLAVLVCIDGVELLWCKHFAGFGSAKTIAAVRIELFVGLSHELLVFRLADTTAFVFIELREVFGRSEEHTSELQSLMRSSYAVFCLKKKIQ